MIETIHDFWNQKRKELGAEIMLSTFKNWNPVRSIPLYTDIEGFEGFGGYAAEDLAMIEKSPWKQNWKQVLQAGEPKLGHSEESFKQACQKLSSGETTTRFRLKSLHHVLTLEELLGKSVMEYNNIIEFGAGIGDTAHTILDRGWEPHSIFSGRYQIFDFPETQRISNYYLQHYNASTKFPQSIEEIHELC